MPVYVSVPPEPTTSAAVFVPAVIEANPRLDDPEHDPQVQLPWAVPVDTKH